MRLLFILFVVMPIVEMIILIKVGGMIGALPTIGLVLLTATIGVGLLRQQGLSTLTRAQDKMRTGQLPASEMVEGLFLAVGGALLLTPGFVTDAIGFACLIPGIRQLLFKAAAKCFSSNVVFYTQGRSQWNDVHGDSETQRSFHTTFDGQTSSSNRASGAENNKKTHSTLEGEYTRED